MEQILGIKYGNATGRRYVQVDLDVHGENELLQDFLDGLEVEAAKNEKGEYVPLEEFMQKEYKRRGLK
ncbi:MAG: hypothetical protein LBO71_01220 [Prevotellaceae bacterium]|jgi:hypothetical protein|nr:hypothetical protein [Prevotellaceae bacterium]